MTRHAHVLWARHRGSAGHAASTAGPPWCWGTQAAGQAVLWGTGGPSAVPRCRQCAQPSRMCELVDAQFVTYREPSRDYATRSAAIHWRQAEPFNILCRMFVELDNYAASESNFASHCGCTHRSHVCLLLTM